ncbi:MAG: MATE family efflux transporter [candidate division Zixibacteria bacterium]|nr:MATE family efflux transporter [candidate division Zixibacteria bacterium]
MNSNGQKKKADFTEGSIIGSILKMGLPSMFGFLSQNIYTLVDTYWVSRLPEEEAAVAALTFFGTILWMFFSFNQLVGPGSVAVISRRYGEKEYELVEKAIKETLFLKLFFGFLFGIIGYFTVDEMLLLMGAKDLAFTLGVEYGKIMFLGMGIMFATYSIFTAMRGVANPQMAMILMIGSNVLNMILDPIFIFGYYSFPAMGVEGAAYASVVSFSLTFIIGMYLFYFDYTSVRLKLKSTVKISLKSMWKLLKIGIPAWAGSMSFSGARLIIMPLIATFGTNVVAAYGIGNQITALGIMILVGIGLGLSSLIGHNIGSGKIERAKKTADQAIYLSVGLMIFFGVISFIFSSQIIKLFFEAEETVRIGTIMLKIFAVGYPFLGMFFMVEEIHMGVGLNTPTMIMNIIHSWIFEVIPIYFLTQYLGYSEVAIWWIITIAGTITSLMFYWYYKRGRWLTVKV